MMQELRTDAEIKAPFNIEWQTENNNPKAFFAYSNPKMRCPTCGAELTPTSLGSITDPPPQIEKEKE